MSPADPGASADGAATLRALLRAGAQQRPGAVAVAAPGHRPLTWAGLDRLVGEAAEALRARGLGRRDRVLSVLDDGPTAVTAFLAVADVAAFVPLSPATPPAELDITLELLAPTALLVPAGVDRPIRALAAARSLPVLEAAVDADAEAGHFALRGAPRRAGGGIPGLDDVALVLHTSGTTARAKVVPLTHRNLSTAAGNFARAHELGPDDCLLNVAPMFHVHGLLPVLTALAAGGSVACPPGFQAPRFFEWLDELAPSWLTAAPAVYEAILARAAEHRAAIGRSRLRFLRIATATAAPDLLGRMEAAFGVPAIQVYGLTETSIVSANPLPPRPRKPGSVGLPAMEGIRIADEAGRPLPTGEIGQLLLRGPNVAAGYENDPEGNARAFIDGWFRTGDAAWIDGDGYIFIAGRLDEIINRGGQKVSPPEVEDALRQHPAVAEVAAFPLPDPVLGQEIGAAVVLRPAARATEAELRAFAAARIATYKVPRTLVLVDAIPRGSTGKVPRNRLAEALGLERPRPAPAAPVAFAPPRTPAERAVAEIWIDVLRVERVGRDDDFFALGGDSILAALATARAGARLGVQLGPLALFEAPTLAAFAGAATTAEPTPTADDGPGAAAGPAPASFAQRRLWLQDRLHPGSARYNLAHALRLDGALDAEALRAALDAIVERHAPLRAAFALRDGELLQTTGAHRPLDVERTDLSALAAAERADALRAVIDGDARRPFDLGGDRLLRARLVRLDAESHVLVLVVNHIAADAWSLTILFRELSELYRARREGATAALPPLARDYTQLARRQRAQVDGPAGERWLGYWRERLAGIPLALEPPFDRPRPAAASDRGARLDLALPPSLRDALVDLARRERATLFMALLAGLAALLARLTGNDDLVIGAPVAGRTASEAEPLIGFFVNTLPLRVDAAGDPPFRELLARVRAAALGAYAHGEMPFERLVEALHVPRHPARPPLVQVALALHQSPLDALDLPGLRVTPLPAETGTSIFDLTLFVVQSGAELRVVAEYSTDLFREATIARLVDHWLRLLAGAAATPERPISALPLLDDAERKRLGTWGVARAPFPADRAVHELFGEQARRRPGAVAVADGGRALTYAQLDARANRLAHHLIARGARAGAPVGLCMERSAEAVVALLAILKAGCAYLPLDPAYPAERLALMVAAAGASLVLTTEALAAPLAATGAPLVLTDAEAQTIAAAPDSAPPVGRAADDLAYVMFTSGSTGAPKAVAIPHRAIARLVVNTDYAALGEDDVVAQASTLSFDASTFEIWGALLNGARLAVIPTETLLAPRRLGEALRREGITALFLTPAVLARIADEAPGILRGLRHVVVGGDVLEPQWAAAVLRAGPPRRLVNGYGPTETTTFAAWHLVTPADTAGRIPLGRPIANTELQVLDARLEPVPVGVPGELCIGGPGLARGYLDDPQLTAQRFVPHPARPGSGDRLYRTGDRARWRPDGVIEFLGRLDRQVKIRGFRVEPAETEAALARVPGVRQSAVEVRDVAPGDRRLIAYVAGSDDLAPEALRAALRRQLPEHLVPSAFVVLPALPLNESGKVDRRALPAGPARPTSARHVAPWSTLEHELLAIWEPLLGVRPLGVRDDFFECGGHSLLAARMMDQVAQRCGRAVPLSSLLGEATVERLAALLAAAEGAEPAGLVEVQRGEGRAPLVFLHGDMEGGGFYCARLARVLGPAQPVWALPPSGLNGQPLLASVEAMADQHLEILRRRAPRRTSVLAGYCNGAHVALELARRLRDDGWPPVLVVLIAPPPAMADRLSAAIDHALDGAGHLLPPLRAPGLRRAVLDGARRVTALRWWLARPRLADLPEALRGAPRRGAFAPTFDVGAHYLAERGQPMDPEHRRRWETFRDATRAYRPRPYDGRVVLVQAEADARGPDATQGWRHVAPALALEMVPGDHVTLITAHLERVGEVIGRHLGALQSPPGPAPAAT